MRYGFIIPGGSATEQLELAVLAEQSGWDAVFVWEGGYAVDAWSLLAAMAVRTERVRLGTMLTPLPWRRPWKLAGQVTTLDQLSGGRAIVTVGLGAPDPVLGDYGEITDRRTRAELLDEGIDIVSGLWAGERTMKGTHHTVDLSGATYFEPPPPVQDPRPPIWVVGAWPKPKSMTRVLRCDGLVPTTVGDGDVRQSTPEELVEMLNWLDDHGGRRPGFDVVVEGETEPGDASPVRTYQESGATWWLESRWQASSSTMVRERIEAGTPSD